MGRIHALYRTQMTALRDNGQNRAALLAGQRRVLERVANGEPLVRVLEALVGLIEEQALGLRCAVLLAELERQRLRFVAAPSIPEDYKVGIEPFLRIAPNMGSCGTAAFLREPVYTRDTATDILWKDCGDIAVRNGLRAIWSTPILSRDRVVLGTFAMYYGEPRVPLAEHIQLIDMAVQLARVAIQHEKHLEQLRASRERASRRWLLRHAQCAEVLSAQEERVLALVARGKTNKEVAAELGLSDKTVKNYLSRIFQKLQVGRRAHAAEIYRRSGPD